MSRQSYRLKIEKPCEQEWSSMTKTDIGKFCSHCSKTVVDFTQLSDDKIIQIIEENSIKLCGRLTKEQLNREVQSYQLTNNSRLYKILAGLLLIGTSGNLLAKNPQKLKKDITSIVDDNNVSLQFTKTKSKLTTDTLKNVVQGLVIDSKTKEPLPFAIIYIKGTKTGTVTELDGKFKFIIPDSLLAEKIYLVIAFIGYEKTEIVINKNELPITKNLFIIPEEQAFLGEVTIIKKKKWWQRKRKASHKI